MEKNVTRILAGLADNNPTLLHRIQFVPPDASVIIDFADGSSIYLVRDIEMARARAVVPAKRVCCPADFIPPGGLSADRDTALAQAAAECLRQAKQSSVQVDRTLPYLYAHFIRQADIAIHYSAELGVMDRRIKTEKEIEYLRQAQQVTGEAMTHACRTVAHAKPDSDGILHDDGSVLTSERLRSMITAFLLERNFSNHHDSIVATAPHAVDCHHFGSGPLRAQVPVVVDIFPMDQTTRYHGDMTRTVVWGEPADEVTEMHKAVCAAKKEGCAALVQGTTGHTVHQRTTHIIQKNGYPILRGQLPDAAAPPSMTHGTGHGIGLEVHEPILLDHGGGQIFANEVFTVEPALYSHEHGCVRVEDMALVTETGHQILAPIHEGLNWRD
jgi:Xaa-Pro aminopeptidase